MKEKQDDTVYLTSKVNEIFAITEVEQYFTNELKDPIELKIIFPILKEISLSKFVVSMDDKVIVSKVMPKEKAEEKYSDTIASGNVGFISRYEDNNQSYSVNIGNLAPNKQVKLQSIFIQMIESKDLSYEFSIMENYPAFYYKGMTNSDSNKNKKIDANIKIETQSKITRLISKYLNEEIKNNSNYNKEYSQDYTKVEIKYKNDKPKLSRKKNEDDKNSFSILFRTENMNKPILYSQYNPELKETAYSMNYTYTSKYLKEIPIPEKPDEDSTISYVSKYEENVINETPGLFVFLIDQSGSMDGNPIELVKKSLLLFIQSLPEHSYFQLIGFGSDFKKYNNEPVIYNKENVDYIIKIINKLDADLGGTNISGPLRAIFNDDCYSKINLSRNIFLLTDGVVFDKEQCIELISNNSSKFRIHSLGIGNDFDRDLIKQCGKLGKGSSSFIENLENMNSVVIDVLNKSLRPYITDLKFEFENYKEEISLNIITVNPINNFTYQNEIINYSFILPGNKELSDLKMKITGKDPINKIENSASFNKIIKLEDGEEMSKMIVGKALKNNEELTKDEKKEIQFAKKYQTLSKNTALFAEILNEESQQSKLIKINLINNTDVKERTNSNNYSLSPLGFPSFNNISPLRYHQSCWSIPSFSAPPMNNFNYAMNNPMMMNKMNNNNFGFGMSNMNSMSGMGCNMMGGGMNMMNNNMNMMNNMNNMMGMNMMSNNMNMMMNNMQSQNMMSSPPMQYMNQNSMPSSIPSKEKENDEVDYLSGEQLDYSDIKNESISNPMNNMNKKISYEKADMKLIMSQDIIEGYWNENDYTKKLIGIITSDKFDKIKNKIIALNKGANETKIIFTILVIYYLKTKCAGNLNEYKLVIHKAVKFLQNNGINYDDIVSGI